MTISGTQIIFFALCVGSGVFRFKDLYTAGESGHMKAIENLSTKIQFDDACNIQFTSGTTGHPKGAVLSHHNVVNNAFGVGRRVQYDKMIHRICIPLPLYHCFGCVAGSLSACWYGATCIFPHAGFDANATIRALQDERATSCYGTPTMFVDMLQALQQNRVNVSSMNTGLMSGAPCPQELVMSVMQELNMKDILVMYGMTETSPVTFQCFPSDDLSIRSSSIGFPSDHIEVKVVDENEKVVPAGESGELYIRGYVNFLGYWDDQLKTDEIMTKDRWLKTGDLAVLQPNGYGRIIGRIKDIIIRGGENIYPAEVEEFMMTLPDIIEVQVFGVLDERLGEEVCAWVRVRDGIQLTEEGVKKWCQGKIAHFKIPRYIFFKDSFPRTMSGKIQKFLMREQTLKEMEKNNDLPGNRMRLVHQSSDK